jgi:hypothetical protein
MRAGMRIRDTMLSYFLRDPTELEAQSLNRMRIGISKRRVSTISPPSDLVAAVLDEGHGV